MNTQSRQEFDANWDRQVGCTDQYDRAASNSVWTEMLASDAVGATWGPGVRRAPEMTGTWPAAMAAKLTTPFLMISGATTSRWRRIACASCTRTPARPRRCSSISACSSHQRDVERNHLLLFQGPAEWLTQGHGNGMKSGMLKLGYDAPRATPVGVDRCPYEYRCESCSHQFDAGSAGVGGVVRALGGFARVRGFGGRVASERIRQGRNPSAGSPHIGRTRRGRPRSGAPFDVAIRPDWRASPGRPLTTTGRGRRRREATRMMRQLSRTGIRKGASIKAYCVAARRSYPSFSMPDFMPLTVPCVNHSAEARNSSR